MSCMQDPPRPFFHFENPFRKGSSPKKGSRLSSKFVEQVNEFEENLSHRLRRLSPRSKDDILSLSWMILAVQSLCESHSSIKALITKMELPLLDWDEKWVEVYLDISVKLLDICNAFTSELSQLNQDNLVIKCVLHELDSASSKGEVFDLSSFDRLRRHSSVGNRRADKFRTILDSLQGSLDLPKVKNSTKGKLLMQAMYGVKVETLFICSVFASAFSGNAKNLLDLNVSDTFKWEQSFADLQTQVNSEIRTIYSEGRFTPMKELESVDRCMIKLYPFILDGVQSEESKDFQIGVLELRRRTDELSEGLDLLTKKVNGFFNIVLDGRDALLSTEGIDFRH